MVALALSGCTGDLPQSGTAHAGGPLISDADVIPSAAQGNPQGIDVSYYQGDIDWPTVKAAGMVFAFIRVSDGDDFLDPKFASNWSGANSAGVVRGTYQFFRPEQDATAQANLLLSNMGALQPGDLPPTLDVEVVDGESYSTIANGISTWVSVVEQATGTTPIVYTSPGFWVELGEGSQDTSLWVANWGVSSPELPSSWSNWTFWQYADNGTVAGISGAVDMDTFNGTVDELSGGQQNPMPTPVPTDSPTPVATPVPSSWTYGVDVSTYDGTVDWNELLASGWVFGFIRVADGTTLDDEFSANWPAAADAGVIRGAYQLFRPELDAADQANLLLQQLGDLQSGDLVPTLDVELTDGEDADTVFAGINTWFTTVEQATGVTPMLRTSPGVWDALGAGSVNTPLWVVDWDTTDPDPELPNSWTTFQFWQYSATGTLQGMPESPGTASMDVFNGSADQLEAVTLD
jgi:GH25 family lysozyme M1 (1,4-beta-N-acetylmuramidase)